jgi:hypothetical protein
MGLLGGLFGGGGDDGGDRRREEYRDFAERYDRGAPYEGISNDEAYSRYREMDSNLSDDDYQLSAREAFERMSPEERMEFGQMMRHQSNEQGYDFPGPDYDEQRFQDPDYLAGAMGTMRRQNPDMMSQLMGGMMGGGMGGPMGGGLGGGLMGGGGMGGMGGGMGGGAMGSPVAKAAMAGIAAMAARRMMSGR